MLPGWSFLPPPRGGLTLPPARRRARRGWSGESCRGRLSPALPSASASSLRSSSAAACPPGAVGRCGAERKPARASASCSVSALRGSTLGGAPPGLRPRRGCAATYAGFTNRWPCNVRGIPNLLFTKQSTPRLRAQSRRLSADLSTSTRASDHRIQAPPSLKNRSCSHQTPSLSWQIRREPSPVTVHSTLNGGSGRAPPLHPAMHVTTAPPLQHPSSDSISRNARTCHEVAPTPHIAADASSCFDHHNPSCDRRCRCMTPRNACMRLAQ